MTLRFVRRSHVDTPHGCHMHQYMLTHGLPINYSYDKDLLYVTMSTMTICICLLATMYLSASSAC